MSKLIKNKPVRLTLTHENGHTIEFNIKTLVSMTTSLRDVVIGEPIVHTLEIVLEYDEGIQYNKEELAGNGALMLNE